jgi:hypothetical protein
MEVDMARSPAALVQAVCWIVMVTQGCSGHRPETKAPVVFGPGMLGEDGRYRNEGFSIAFPDGWEIREGSAGLVVMAVSKPSSSDDPYLENCALAVTGLADEVPLAGYKEAAMEQLQRSSQGFLLLEESEGSTFSGIDARRLVYDQEIGELELRMLVYLFVQAKRAFVVTCGTGRDVFDEHRESFEKIAKSFQFETR